MEEAELEETVKNTLYNKFVGKVNIESAEPWLTEPWFYILDNL